MAQKLLIPPLKMNSRQTDKLTEWLREAALEITKTSDGPERDGALATLEARIRDQINVERLEAATRLAGWLAHRINNPLGAISGNAQLLARRLERDSSIGSPEAYLGYVDAIREQTERSAQITGELLEFTKPRDVILRNVDLSDVIRDSVELAQYGRGQVDVSVDRESVKALSVLTDKELLTRALYEVILNGIIAAGEGGTVSITIAASPEWIEMNVRDTGAGIPDEALNRVFDPFFSTREKTRGLGLTASLGIIRQLRGTLDIKETGPTGTTMVIRIPAGEGAA